MKLTKAQIDDMRLTGDVRMLEQSPLYQAIAKRERDRLRAGVREKIAREVHYMWRNIADIYYIKWEELSSIQKGEFLASADRIFSVIFDEKET